jgi:hypothetical protein
LFAKTPDAKIKNSPVKPDAPCNTGTPKYETNQPVKYKQMLQK